MRVCAGLPGAGRLAYRRRMSKLNALAGRLTYANVVATLALFIALGGASYAAIKIPKNAVGTKHIKKGAITADKIQKGAITAEKVRNGAIGTGKIRNGSLTEDDFEEFPEGEEGPAGFDGRDGLDGLQGPQGPPGSSTQPWVVVNADGTKARGSADATSAHVAGPGNAGEYTVSFAAGNLSGCGFLATLDNAAGSVSANGGTAATDVEVVTYNAGGAATDLAFNLIVNC
jgi:hypothetical protein